MEIRKEKVKEKRKKIFLDFKNMFYKKRLEKGELISHFLYIKFVNN